MIAVWQQRVRNYARRQLTWFRQTRAIQWVNIPAEEHPWETAARILDLVRSHQVAQKIAVESS